MPLVFKISGDAEIRRNIDAISAGLREDAVRAALLSAGDIVVAKAQSLCPAETGTLRKSLGLFIRESRRGKTRGSEYAVIGARRGAEFTGTGPDGRKRVPANYAHLVEFGHVIANGRSQSALRTATRGASTGGFGFVSPKPFLRPAIAGSVGAVRAAFIAALSAFHARAQARVATFRA